VNLYKGSLSAFPIRVSIFSLIFPEHAAMSGTFGKNFLDPDFVWGFRTVRMSSIQWEDTPALL
jgi:hypothetical protein